MKLLLILCFALVAFPSFAQCISIKEMRTFVSKDLSQRNDFMKMLGYRLVNSENLGGKPIVWQSNRGEDNFAIYKDVRNKENVMVVNQLPESKSCIQAIKLEISALGLHKDGETSNTLPSGGKEFVIYYSNKNYGVRIGRTTLQQGVSWNSVHYFTLKSAYSKFLNARQ